MMKLIAVKYYSPILGKPNETIKEIEFNEANWSKNFSEMVQFAKDNDKWKSEGSHCFLFNEENILQWDTGTDFASIAYDANKR